MTDLVNHPIHYAEATHGIQGECIDYSEHLDFRRGNGFKYAWRAGFKGDATQDLEKALWYVNRDIRHGDGTVEGRPGQLTYALGHAPTTLRQQILWGIWSRHELVSTRTRILYAIDHPEDLDRELTKED